MAKKQSKKAILKKLTEYGIHIWAILIIANAVLVYAFHFSIQASLSTQKNDQTKISSEVEDPNDINNQIPKLDLSFTIPGVGSGGGTMKPKRTSRNVTIYLYAPDANSLNENVKPLYIISNKVTYDTNPQSPTYTAYTNHALPLGNDVKEGDYQIVFRTDESLRTIIKEYPDDVGGKVVNVMSNALLDKIPLQTVLMGDTIPKEGDNKVDISDYNAFVNCYGEKNKTDFCTKNNYGDFDDNGVIDGIDFNILARTFSALLQQGQKIPQVTTAPTSPSTKYITPTTKQNQTVKAKPTTPAKIATNTAIKKSGGNPLMGLFFFIFIIFVLFIFLFLKNKSFKNKILALLHKNPPTETKPEAQPVVSAATAPQTASIPTPQETSPVTTEIAAETEIDPKDLAAPNKIPVNQSPKPDENIAAPPPSAQPESTQTAPTDNTDNAKSYYVKKKLQDDAKTGFWLVLTDDNGAIDAHYTGADVPEGFAKINGTMKDENGKKFMEVTELTPEG